MFSLPLKMFETENVWKDSSKEEQLSIQLFGNNINKQQNKKKKKVVTKNSKKHSNLSLASENDLKLNVDKEKCNIVSSDIKMKSVSKKRKHEIAESISSKNIKSKAPKLEKKEVVASDLHQKLFNKLQSSRFRFINEKVFFVTYSPYSVLLYDIFYRCIQTTAKKLLKCSKTILYRSMFIIKDSKVNFQNGR